MGKPTKRTPEVLAKLEECIKHGLSRKMSCAAAGIGYSTFKDWLNDHEEFAADVARWDAEGCLYWAKELRTTPQLTKAAIHYLACHDRDQWAQAQKVEHSGSVNSLVSLLHSVPTADDEGGDDE